MGIEEEVRAFLAKLGSNIESPTAYDTAWVATLSAPDSADNVPMPRFPAALGWLADHQYRDGSWGGPWPYYHDRLLSTLRAVLTLHNQGRWVGDQRRIERGIGYIWRNAGGLGRDPWETVGFELIFPTLLAEAEQQGLALPYAAFAHVQQMRQEKLARAPLALIYDRHSPLPVNLEGLGPAFELERARHIQEENGAVGMSPSATAFLLQHWPDNAPAHNYIERALQEHSAESGVPAYYPLETFERTWALYQLQYAMPEIYEMMPQETLPILRFLEQTRTPAGWTASRYSSVKESDTTGVCFAILGQAGYDLDPQILYQYAESNHFRVYPFERNPSISANAHVLSGLHYCPPKERVPFVEKVLGFLLSTRQPGGYWFDKWHVSPYYVSSRVIVAAHDFAPDLVQPAIEWIRYTQRPNGGWGYYAATAEETAYAVLALLAWRDAEQSVPERTLRRGIDYLQRNLSLTNPEYPPLWIGKVLYVPVLIVQAAVLAALLAAERRL